MERDDQDRPPKPGESDGERSEEEPLRPGLDAADDPDEELDHTILSSPDLEATRVGDSSGPRVSSPATGSLAADSRPGDRVGPYELVERIAEGGMGEVWLAEQVERLRRRVALKLVKLGMDTREFLRRFEAERQTLAIMDHPCIARIYDAGATDNGRPWFAMEYVPGEALNDYCESRRLTTKQRVELFIEVCYAIQHAHQKGIIHRDLKPSNILVVEQDGQPVPKVIDFGIAKAMSESGGESRTVVGQVIGTPEYLSPEQADASEVDVDTRADLYSLGVVLYEVMTGSLPFERKKFQDAGLREMLRVIREEEPPRPSARLTKRISKTDLPPPQRAEQMERAKQLRGDLDWIVMKALAKERDRRYATATGFAKDLTRFLQKRAVSARPPSRAYLFRRFVQRNRVIVSFMTLLALAVVGGAIGTGVGLVRAKRETAKAAAINGFLLEMLQGVNPDQAQGREVTVREMLDAAAAKVGLGLTSAPEVESDVRLTIGSIYSKLGRYDDADPHIKRVFDLRNELYGSEDSRTLDALNLLAINLFRAQDHDRAQKMFAQQLDLRRRLLGERHPDTLTSMHNLAASYLATERYDEAEPMLRETLEGRRAILGEHDAGTLATMSNLARLYSDTERIAEAEPLLAEVLSAREVVLGGLHPRTLIAAYNLGELSHRLRRFEQALALLERAESGFESVLDKEHPYTLLALVQRAETLEKLGRDDEARSVAIDAHARHVDRFGQDHDETRRVATLLRDLAERRGDGESAARWQAELSAEPEPETQAAPAPTS